MGGHECRGKSRGQGGKGKGEERPIGQGKAWWNMNTCKLKHTHAGLLLSRVCLFNTLFYFLRLSTFFCERIRSGASWLLIVVNDAK